MDGLRLCGILVSIFIYQAFAIDENERGYVITLPNRVNFGSTEKLCLMLNGYENEVNVHLNISLPNDRYLHEEDVVFREGNECVDFTVPRGKSIYQLNVQLIGRDSLNREEIFRHEGQLFVSNKALITFIETDKPIYKPGQKVNFRVLSLDQHLKPLKDTIDSIKFIDPRGVTVEQWTDIELDRGMASFEVQLSSEPRQGEWKIETTGTASHEITFKVEEYVLPKYELVIRAPEFAYSKDDKVSVEVCALYTYGKGVQGNVSLEVEVIQTYHWWIQHRPKDLKLMINNGVTGCTTFDIDIPELDIEVRRFSKISLKLNADFFATLTGNHQTAKEKYVSVSDSYFSISLDESPEYYKPYLPYTGKGVVTLPDGGPGVDVQVTVESYVNHAEKTHSENYTTDSSGMFTFSVPALFTENEIRLKAFVRGHEGWNRKSAFRNVQKWFSPSDNYLVIEPARGTQKCGETFFAQVSYTYTETHEYTFYYQLLARGNIIENGEIKQSARFRGSDVHSLNTFEITVPIDFSKAPKASLLVYYVRPDREVIAANLQIDVEKCLANDVKMEFSKDMASPGEEVDLMITANRESLCGISVVDKSVHILGGDNQLSLEKIYTELSSFFVEGSYGYRYKDEYCWKKCHPEVKEDEIWDEEIIREKSPCKEAEGGRNKRDIWNGPFIYGSSFVDASEAFLNHGVLRFTNLDIDTRPCEINDNIMPVYYAESMIAIPDVEGIKDNDGVISKESKTSIRSYFPESWLWGLHDLKGATNGDMKVTAPDTITTWIGKTFCINAYDGFGVSGETTLTVFKPFFASFNLPYSVVRGENFPVLVTVSSYIQDELEIRLSLMAEEWFDFGEETVESSIVMTLSNEETKGHTFRIIPKMIGSLNLTIKAVVIGGKALRSIDDSNLVDSVVRSIIVESEGREEEETIGVFICPIHDDTRMPIVWDLKLPENVYADSARGFFSVIGDVLGSAMSNIDNLVKLPTGCGEQNMLKFAPNIYVLNYLKSSGQLKPELNKTLLDYLKIGYKNELNYQHSDGSYSAFGESDESGSTWLTAFVTKSYAEALDYIFIDAADLERSQNWFRERQLPDGCFEIVGKVLHSSMKGGLSGGEPSPVAMTAYVLIALLESGLKNEDDMIRDGLACLSSYSQNDAYTLSLLAYVYSLYDVYGDERALVLEKLHALSVIEDSYEYWNYPESKSTSIETTAYVLISKMMDENKDISNAMPIVQWLSAQRNPNGGFSSTQDTVVGLQALSMFAAATYVDSFNIRVKVSGDTNGAITKQRINDDNRLSYKEVSIQVPDKIYLSITGEGCVYAQVAMKYSVEELETTKGNFELDVAVTLASDDCKSRDIKIIAKNSKSTSNMVIIEVKMVTGWTFDEKNVEILKKLPIIKRIDFDKDSTKIYLDEITEEEPVEFYMKVQQVMEVKNSQPGYVKVYDYYSKDEINVQHPLTLPDRPCELALEPKPFLNIMDEVELIPEFVPEKDVFVPSPCPVCISSFEDDMCDYDYVYQTKSVPADKSVKLMKDVRNSNKKINKVVTHDLPDECRCDVLSEKGKRFYVLTSNEAVIKRRNSFLSFDDSVVVAERISNLNQRC